MVLPLALSPLTEKRMEVAEEMYEQLCMKFSRTYGGFRTERREILSYSEAGSGDDQELDDSESARAFMERMKRRKV